MTVSLTDSGKIIKRINPKCITDMRRKLKKLTVKVNVGEVPSINIENMFKSWMCDFYKLMFKQQRHNLLELYEELFDKTIVIISTKMIITGKPPLKQTVVMIIIIKHTFTAPYP